MFNITFHLISDRDFKVFQVSATKCSEYSVVLLFRHNLISVCYSVKALKTFRNQYYNGLKTPRVKAVYSFLF